MSADKRRPGLPVGIWFTESHHEALATTNILFGGYCGLMCIVSVVAWRQGTVSGVAALAICGHLALNMAISAVSSRVRDGFAVESFRALSGLLVAPVIFALVDGALASYWPIFAVICLGGLLVLGLTGQRIFWSRLLVAVHVVLLLFTGWLFPPRVDIHSTAEPIVNWPQLIMEAGAFAMVCLLTTQIMALLGKTLVGMRERSAELTAARDALFAELNVAHEIQMLLLPKDPQLPDSLVSGKMIPATEVGGDYYDVIDLQGGRSFMAMGDVSGHGLTSGLTMMMARTALLGILESRPDTSLVDAYRALNRCLRHNLSRMGIEMYMTFVLLESLSGGRFEAVGQHLPLIVYRHRTGTLEEIELEGVWLGLVEDLTPSMLPTVRFTLEPGDLLILYTDGVVEHFGTGREMFGFGRFKELLRQNASLGPAGLIEATLAGLKNFSEQQRDDVTLLVINHQGDRQASRVAQAAASTGS